MVLLGCPGVGKRTLVREVMKHMADGDFADYDEPVAYTLQRATPSVGALQGVQQFAIINGQRTLLVCHDIYVEEEGHCSYMCTCLRCGSRDGRSQRGSAWE